MGECRADLYRDPMFLRVVFHVWNKPPTRGFKLLRTAGDMHWTIRLRGVIVASLKVITSMTLRFPLLNRPKERLLGSDPPL